MFHSNPDVPLATLKQEWHALAKSAPLITSVSMLESISTREFGPDESVFLKISDIVDLSRLRSLEIGNFYSPFTLSRVAVRLPNLERLFISAFPGKWGPGDVGYLDLNSDNENAIAAIQAFNALEYLHISSIRAVSSLNQIIQHHGPTLKGLVIEACKRFRMKTGKGDYGYKYPEMDSGGIRQLAQFCPQLEELRLPIKRSLGNQSECEMYKAVGYFANLHSLVLDLHFDIRPLPLGRQRHETEISRLREILANATTDENLVLGIWNLVSANQASRNLRNLRIMPFGDDMLLGDENTVLECFARSFLVTRNAQGESNMSQLGKREREIRHEWTSLDSDEEFPERLDRLLWEIWPSGPKGNNWLSLGGQTSLPLHPDGVSAE